MHELSVANSIVESVCEAVLAERSAVVQAVHVRVGALSGVVPRALDFAWSSATAGSRLDGSTLKIEHVAAVAWCPACDAEVELPGVTMRCPDCGAATPRLVRGHELDILSVELADDPRTETEQTTHP